MLYRIFANYIDYSYGFKPYAPQCVTVRPSSTKLVVNEKTVMVDAYTINSNNHFKLRDVMLTFDIGVGWDGATGTATITTGDSYALAAYEQDMYNAHIKAYEAASGNPYTETPIMQEDAIRFISTPDVLEYNVGEPFKQRASA